MKSGRWSVHIIHNVVIDCSDGIACSDLIVDALNGESINLRADESDSVVNGSVSINHNHAPEPHEIMIVLYDEEELPNETHTTTLRPANPMPTEEELIQRLTTYLEDN